ncbi:MAG TPA: cytochrome c [Bryobacteraceae bacterium]|nr:cytochrome c [Bryobacteraceae bacterium]
MRFLLLAVFLTAIAHAQQPAGNAENGKRLFARDGCYECHGYAAQGSRDGPRLAATSLPAQVVINYVRRPFGAMPAYTPKVLSDHELADIYAFLKSLPAARPAKDIPLLDQLRNE